MLARIRAHVREAVDRLQDCTCIETVARFRKPADKEPKLIDRAVLQILFSGDKELSASPGDARWESNPLAIVTGGMMGDGVFALHLRAVFLNNQSNIKYHGEELRGGRREARYDYTMSRMLSGFTIQHAGAIGVVAVRGSFWADPTTYDIRQLEFHAEEIPAELLYTDVSTNIEYARVRIGPREVLLPQDADLRTTGADGEEHRNVIAFTHCRGFSTESTVHFDDAAPAAESAASASKPIEAEGTLPQGLRISVALRTPLNDETTVGSLIEGKVVGNVMQKRKVLVPEGTLVQGRIRRMERYSDSGDYFILALEFVRFKVPGGNLRFYATFRMWTVLVKWR